jgi:hypothetical protein
MGRGSESIFRPPPAMARLPSERKNSASRLRQTKGALLPVRTEGNRHDHTTHAEADHGQNAVVGRRRGGRCGPVRSYRAGVQWGLGRLRLRAKSLVPRRFLIHGSGWAVPGCRVGHGCLPHLVSGGHGQGQRSRGAAQSLRCVGRTQPSAPCTSSGARSPWTASASRYVLEHVDSRALPGRLASLALQPAGATMRRAASTAAERRAEMISRSAVTASGWGDCAQAKATPNKRTSRSIGCHDGST